MTTTEQASTDQFSYWTTEILISICFRVTPVHERECWVVTSAGQRYEQVGRKMVEVYSKSQLRDFAIEQLECMNVSHSDIATMKS